MTTPTAVADLFITRTAQLRGPLVPHRSTPGNPATPRILIVMAMASPANHEMTNADVAVSRAAKTAGSRAGMSMAGCVQRRPRNTGLLMATMLSGVVAVGSGRRTSARR